MSRGLSRGLKNCNPGNIRISGVKYLGEVLPSKDKAFKQFQSIAWGYRAMFVLLYTYSKRGDKTLRQMITRYAPPIENDTNNYLNFVALRSGTSFDTPLDTLSEEQMIPIIASMSHIENGTPAILDDVTAGWKLFRKHKP